MDCARGVFGRYEKELAEALEARRALMEVGTLYKNKANPNTAGGRAWKPRFVELYKGELRLKHKKDSRDKWRVYPLDFGASCCELHEEKPVGVGSFFSCQNHLVPHELTF